MSKKKKLDVFAYDEKIKRVLCVVAHPDDIDFGFAGTVATLTAHGAEVAYCLITSGDAGGDGSTHTKEERAAIREAEQTAAAAVLGVSDLTFLKWPDGLVEPTILLRREIARVIRAKKPDLVITQNPERNWERIYGSHPDHMAAGEATMRAVYPDARNPHAFPEMLREGFEPHTVPTVWIGGHPNATLAVDVTKKIDHKLNALLSHQSQVGHRDDLEKMIKEWAKTNAKTAGMEKGRMAEIFKVVNTA
jgi:LmbE family N-acetylglucosaminyl deacetylase